MYQWQRSATEGGIYTDIAGATANTYTLTGSDYNNYVRVAVTAIGAITGTTQTGETLTAGTLTHQKRQPCINGSEAIPKAVSIRTSRERQQAPIP